MTSKDITDRYLSDVHSIRSLYENGKIDRFEYDERIAALDNNLFGDFEFLSESDSLVERIAAYSS